MEGIEKQKNEMLFAGHLEEVDDLQKYGRDAPLAETEKNKEDLNVIVDTIASRTQELGKKAVMLISSSKMRTEETAKLIGTEIKQRLGDAIKIRYTSEEGLRAPDQGEFILPENYEPGSFFEGLKIASDIFYEESLNRSDQNVHYRFGDPVVRSDGSYKYPALAKYFKESGETYAESLSRLLKLVVEMGEKVEKLHSSVEVVLVGHGFTYEIFKSLSVLAEKVKNEGVQVNVRDIPHKLSEIYESRVEKLRDRMCVPLDITNLGDQELLDLLRDEIKLLEEGELPRREG